MGGSAVSRGVEVSAPNILGAEPYQGMLVFGPPTGEARLVADFGFNSASRDKAGMNAGIELVNTRFIRDRLFLNGNYDTSGRLGTSTDVDGFRAVAWVPAWSYDAVA